MCNRIGVALQSMTFRKPGQRSVVSSEAASRLKVCLECDKAAYGVSRWWYWSRLQYPTLHYQRVLRYTEHFQNRESFLGRVTYAILRVRLKRLGQSLGLSVPPGVFGPGLSIPHYGSVVVNDKVRAGAFCRVHSATNLGESRGGAPQLGNGVYVGPGSVLYGDISVGDRAVIGANSVVNKTIPANRLAIGAPASVSWVSDAHERAMPERIIVALDMFERASDS